jgi:hypothetical protein
VAVAAMGLVLRLMDVSALFSLQDADRNVFGQIISKLEELIRTVMRRWRGVTTENADETMESMGLVTAYRMLVCPYMSQRLKVNPGCVLVEQCWLFCGFRRFVSMFFVDDRVCRTSRTCWNVCSCMARLLAPHVVLTTCTSAITMVMVPQL